MSLSVGILAGSRADGINEARVRASNRIIIGKLAGELGVIGDVLVSAAKKDDYEDLHCVVMEDQSPMEGLYNILSSAKGDYVFVCGADMPGISAKLVKYMSEFICSDYDCYCLADEKRIQPLCAIYSKAMLPLIEEALKSGDYKLMNLIRRARVKYISIEYTSFGREVLTNTMVRTREKKSLPKAVFCVSGPKNSGKTGLITRLINEFIEDGHSVGAIKHDGHHYEMDREGTDTHKFLESGATGSAIFAGGQYTLNLKEETTEVRLLEFFSRCDVIVIEGLKNSPYPKIEMMKEAGDQSLCDPETLICIATEKNPPQASRIPVFDRDDTEGIFSLVKKYFDME